MWKKEEGRSGCGAFAAPADHLFGLMGIDAGAPEGVYPVGEGAVCILRNDPKEYVLEAGADEPPPLGELDAGAGESDAAGVLEPPPPPQAAKDKTRITASNNATIFFICLSS